ncbi:L,D-transpeptidase family protein [Mucilaginibacter sp. BJC16-A38]|uniref:L,D-transpeptidase family protein n=1 Tax=Mucilaginibacter phenanthrenivorans TaxID=1234842 RepID=UPI002157446D|nr:L,D-transpeptidase family protein [Mucilaginibacter phenanthrenivorans]MCR8560811.1 L,D-transpeptidase family protein [Mucilaginibacter phenanthrenivorans]
MAHRRYSYILLFLLSFCFLQNVWAQHGKQKTAVDTLSRGWNQTIPGSFSSQSGAVFDSIQINRFLTRFPDFKNYAGEINTFYKGRNYAYAWFDGGRLIEQAGNLSNRVLNLQNEGIYKSAPYQKELDSLMYITSSRKNEPDIQVELMLTAQYFAFSNMAWQGMNSEVSQSAKWYVPRKKMDYEQYLDSLLKEPAKRLASADPVYRQYEMLRAYLRKYRSLDAQDNWTAIVIPLTGIKIGDTSAVIPIVKARLYKLDDLHGDTLDHSYNIELVTAVKQFQSRHGLVVDGLLNKETVAALNVPLKSRIKQILVNMERSRWLPVSLNTDYLAVNIPEFKLHVYHADSLMWSCNVVVGQTVNPTTVFYGTLRYVVFSPYWAVPPSIVRKEIIPALKRKRGFLSANHMEITGYEDGLPVIRQLPGPENSLGLVKFLFPNSYNIYLHDTPSKSLFGESSRAFSHGCIRVQEPVKLANFLLKGQRGWNAEKVDIAMHAGKEQYVTLQHKVPVFIAYFTAFIDRNNQLNFRDDIYHLDEQLTDMILSGTGSY